LLVEWLTQLERLDLAFGVANRAIDACAEFGTLPPNWQTLWTPELRPLREHHSFPLLARRLRFVEYWNRFGPPDT
jgi:hypothetical protein